MTRTTNISVFGVPGLPARKRKKLSTDAFTPAPKGRGKLTFEWTGDASGSASDGGNWDSDAGTIPVNGDCAIFNQGSVDVTAGLNQSGVPLQFLGICPAYTGTIGSSSGSLQYTSRKVVIRKRTGAVYLSTGDGAECDVYIHDTSANTTAGSLSTISGRRITNLIITATRGTVVIENGSVVDNIVVTPRAGRSVDLTIGTAVQTATGITPNIRVHARGQVASESFLFKLDLHGGIVRTIGNAGAFRVNIDSSGILQHEAAGIMGFTSLNVYGGALTMRDNENGTISLYNATIYDGGVLDIETDQNTAVVTNDIVFYGGRLKPGLSRTVTPA